MTRNEQSIFLKVTGVLVAIGLQIWAEQWRLFYEQRIVGLQFGTNTLWFGLVDIVLCMFSGFLIASLLFSKERGNTPTALAILILLISGVGVGLKIAYAVTSIQLPVSMGMQILISNWVISGAPSFLLGVAGPVLFGRKAM